MPDNVEVKAAQKRKVGRSPSYPTLNVQEALEKARALYNREGDYAAPLSSAAAAWDYSAKSSGSRQVLATLRYYGLIDVTGDGDTRKIKISDTARRILLDKREDDTERRQLLRKVALNPSVHRTLHEEYKSGLASDSSVIHFLVFDHGFNESAAGEVLAEFKETAKIVGLYDAPKDMDKGAPKNHTPEPDQRAPEIKVGDRIQWTSQGVDQFAKGALVLGFSEDGQWIFTDQSPGGVPVKEVLVMEQSVQPPAPVPPQMPAHLVAGLAARQGREPTQDMKPGSRKAVFPVDDGDVTLIFPEGISADGLRELGLYLDIFLKKEQKKKEGGVV